MISNPSAINAHCVRKIAQLINSIDNAMDDNGTPNVTDDSACYQIACAAYLAMKATQTMPKETRERYVAHIMLSVFEM